MSGIPSGQKTDLLSHIFPSIGPDAAEQLSSICLEIHHKAGELIAQEESYASGIYIVQSGLVKVGKYGSSGGEKRVLRFLGVGELFGLEAVALDHATHIQYAKTLMASTLLFIERHNLLTFRTQHPGLCTDFTRWLAREVSKDTYVNVMDQYHPAGAVRGGRFPELGRRLTAEEHREAIMRARNAGLHRFDERKGTRFFLRGL